ncbi:MAG: fibronectin type III domain-containing protein [Flavobacteriales bacterium]|nr:fibronectin type III domain-containing protein [Flavobacteriales bacterium]
MKDLFIVKLGLQGLTSAALVEKGRTHIKDCTGNANVTLPANFLADFTQAVDDLEAANIAVFENGGRKDTLARNTAKFALEEFVRELAGYVQAQCNEDALKIASCGFGTRKSPSPVGIVDAPKNLRAGRGKVSGDIDVRWDGVQGRIMYALYICAGDPKVEADWSLLLQTSRNFHTAINLMSDAVYYFRVVAIGTAGPGPVSDSAWSKAA